jgi:uncharacterized membrane protein
MRRRRTRLSGRIVLVAAIAFAAVAVSLAAVGIGPKTTTVEGNGLLNLRTDDLKPGNVKFFSYRDDAGSKIRFLLARDESGDVHAAFDACQRCYSFHKGYTATRDGYLICRLCGNRYKIGDKNLGMASCNPIKLDIQKSGANVQVKSSDLEQARSMF